MRHKFLRRFFRLGCGLSIFLVLRDGSDGRRAGSGSPRPTTSEVATVDTATCWGVIYDRRLAWVEVVRFVGLWHFDTITSST